MSVSKPKPVPPADSVIRLPADQYRHVGAPTEWWWHTGTLVARDRVFGFEINAANFTAVAFSQVMLTDVHKKIHYQKTALQSGGDGWAEADPSKDWYVKLGGPNVGPDWITMNAPQSDPTGNMAVKASMQDTVTGTLIAFDLRMSQQGPAFIVWGSGVAPTPPNAGGVKTNNYYYSLTRIHTSGQISIGNEVIPVEGLTWMDHEYGLFGTSGHPVKWFLQDLQLDNGVHISNSVTFPNAPPQLDIPVQSGATIQFPDGTTYFDGNCTLTPVGRTWPAPNSGGTFFLEFKLDIPSFEASFTVTSLMDDQAFTLPPLLGVGDNYEGIAKAVGTFCGAMVHGTAWNEQQP